MKRIVFIFLLSTCWTMHGNAQQKDSIKIQRPMTLVPESFFNWDDYELSSNYDSVCTPSRWVSLHGDYFRTKTSSGMWDGGTILEFGRDNRFCIILNNRMIGSPWSFADQGNGPCGDYRLDTANGLLYMRWDKRDTMQAKDSFYYNGIVCKIDYYQCKSRDIKATGKLPYREALCLSRYAGATWDMPLEKIKECPTVVVFGPLVRLGIMYKGKSVKIDFP